jgi:hypothetical protein
MKPNPCHEPASRPDAAASPGAPCLKPLARLLLALADARAARGQAEAPAPPAAPQPDAVVEPGGPDGKG